LLDRELRYPLLAFTTVFVAIFGSIGLGLTLYGWRSRAAWRRNQVLAQLYPDEPWRQSDLWVDGIVHPSVARQAGMAWAFAALWTAVSLPIVAFLPGELTERLNYWALITMAFPLIAGLILTAAVVLTLRARRFGQTRLVLDTFPGAIGGAFRARLVLPGSIPALDQVHLTLRCVRQHTTKSGGESSTETTTLWEDTRVHENLASRFGQAELVVPVEFKIPRRPCRASSDADPNDKVSWTLRAESTLPGADLDLSFEVPVYHLAAEGAEPDESGPIAPPEDPRVLVDESPSPRQVQFADIDAHTREYVVSCWPGLGMFLWFLVFVAIFGGVTAFMTVGVIYGTWFFVCMLVFFAPITGLMICMLPGMLGRVMVTIDADQINVCRSWGPIHRLKSIPADQVRSIEYKQFASSGSHRWYTVHAHLGGLRKVAIATMLPGEVTARWFVRQVRERLGLTTDMQPPITQATGSS
ncbi:MAG: hypothetical protein HY718_11400, partial [Planctomycetes bacterium]|nr:hypothetical protein [Planctomycetota bacterium]